MLRESIRQPQPKQSYVSPRPIRPKLNTSLAEREREREREGEGERDRERERERERKSDTNFEC